MIIVQNFSEGSRRNVQRSPKYDSVINQPNVYCKVLKYVQNVAKRFATRVRRSFLVLMIFYGN